VAEATVPAEDNSDLVLVWWAISAIVLIVLGFGLGWVATKQRLGLLIDTRGRYSLTQVQVVTWTIVVLSMIGGVVFARLAAEEADALGFSIPDELLIVMGISVGSAATTTVVKAGKDSQHPDRIAASDPASDKPSFMQVFLVEEGAAADKVIDVTKFQNFWITFVLVVAYVAQAIDTFDAAQGVSTITTLPEFSTTFVTLLGISHAAYVAGKLPDKSGIPRGMTLAMRQRGALASGVSARRAPK
jgi:hypothetical protein